MENKGIETVIDLATAQCDHAYVADTPYLVVPNGYRVENLEHMQSNPTRKRGAVEVDDVQSFISYTKLHGSLASCVIYIDMDTQDGRLKMKSVLNDHSEDHAEWRDFTCNLAPKLSVEWSRWNGNNKKEMSQIAFASFLEDNIQDVASVSGSPTGTEILQMAMAFERTADKKLSSRVNLQSGGVRFEYVDDDSKGTRAAMEAFSRFNIGIPVFYGDMVAFPVEARLKYREKEGKVMFWYELVRADRVFRQATEELLTKIKNETGFMMLMGRP